jgi:hypothetical protein
MLASINYRLFTSFHYFKRDSSLLNQQGVENICWFNDFVSLCVMVARHG